MNVSEYIASFLYEKGVRDIFGYQGTMISYFVDAFYKSDKIHNHSCYNEQGAAFAACGYAQTSGKCGVAYSTSGPGAINLLSGVANAYFDSLPVLFITGQINTYEYSGIEGLRQQGFQECNTVEMAKPVTKYAVQVTDANDIRYELEKAWYLANSGRKGAVLLDIPMNIQRTEVDPDTMKAFTVPDDKDEFDSVEDAVNALQDMLNNSQRPVLMVGNGTTQETKDKIVAFAEKYNIPIVASLLSKDILPADHKLNFGFIGAAYGMRTANMICNAKADAIIAIGISMCTRQIGTKIPNFAVGAKLIRIDSERENLKRIIKPDEKSFCLDSGVFASELNRVTAHDYSEWLAVAAECRTYLNNFDENHKDREPNRIISKISSYSKENCAVVSDVGQHMMWMAQSFILKQGQKMLFSGGHGAMGYGLPAAIGAYYATGKPVYCVAGDGAMQMNIQELQWVKRENLPIKIFVMNNNILGMIHFGQRDYFENRFGGTLDGWDYSACSFADVANAYGISGVKINEISQLENYVDIMENDCPALFEVLLPSDTSAFPKTFLGQDIHNQRPYIPEDKMEYMLNL